LSVAELAEKASNQLDEAFNDVRVAPSRAQGGSFIFFSELTRTNYCKSTHSPFPPSLSSALPSPSLEMAAAKIKSPTSRVANSFPHPTIIIQKNKHASPPSSAGSSPTISKTPKTPADDGVDFFESAIRHGEAPVRVYELPLEPDGGPSKNREVGIRSDPCKAAATLTNVLPSTFVSLPQIFRIFSAFR
jgi:hypothetical protein